MAFEEVGKTVDLLAEGGHDMRPGRAVVQATEAQDASLGIDAGDRQIDGPHGATVHAGSTPDTEFRIHFVPTNRCLGNPSGNAAFEESAEAWLTLNGYALSRRITAEHIGG